MVNSIRNELELAWWWCGLVCPLATCCRGLNADAWMFEIVMTSRHVHVEVFLKFSCPSLYQERERQADRPRSVLEGKIPLRVAAAVVRARARKRDTLQLVRWGSEFSPKGVYEHEC